ncbi:hypothetical protein ACI2OX_17105 [Bacillus sp. N9]
MYRFDLFRTDMTLAWMMLVTAILGLGFGFAYTAFTVAVQSAVQWELRGAAMGSHNLLKNLGQAIGIAVSGLWLSEELKGFALESSLQSVFILLLVLAVCSFAVTGMLLSKKRNLLLWNKQGAIGWETSDRFSQPLFIFLKCI